MIETGTGNCHIYVDETADLEMAADIIMNAKTQRVGVCNACESVLVHKDVKDALLPVLAKRLQEKHVEYQHTEASCEGTYGTSGSDHNEIYHLWKRTGTPIDSTLIFSEGCAILQFRFGITDCFVGNKKSDGVSSDFN